MKKAPPLNYTFAVGKIHALENFLIKPDVFTEAIELHLGEALRLFAESDLYSDEILHVRDSQQLEAVLNQESLKLKTLVLGLILDEKLKDIVTADTLERLEGALGNYPSEFLRDYSMHLVDMHNIKTFLRLYILKEPQEKLEAALNHEGFLRKADLLKLYPQDLTAFLNQLEYVHKHYRTIDYTYHLGEAIHRTVKESSFIYLEKAIADFLMEILKPAKYIIFGPEPVLAYYLAKVNEMNLIRLIILAKLNQVSADIVKERLNNVYA